MTQPYQGMKVEEVEDRRVHFGGRDQGLEALNGKGDHQKHDEGRVSEGELDDFQANLEPLDHAEF